MTPALMIRRTAPALALAAAFASPVAAQPPIQIAFVTPIQIVPDGKPVRGLSINLIYGANTSVEGEDVGLPNPTPIVQPSGIQWASVNLSYRHFNAFPPAPHQ